MLKNIDNVKSNSISKHFNKAFTIVELLIVIVIIGILAAITIVSYTGISKKAGESTVQAELANAKKQITLYHVDHGAYPTSLEDGTNCLKGTVAPSPDTKYCLKSSAGSTFTLTDATGSDYTLTLTKGTTIAYKVTKDTGPISTTPVVAGAASFVKTWGGVGNDVCYNLTQTSDGGYAVTGSTTSFGAGSNDMFLAKYDSNGNLSWNKLWGGTGYDLGHIIIQTSDGGYAIAGYTGSFGAGSGDVLLVKYDASGNLSWSKTWGGSGDDWGNSLTQTSDGGYAIAGYTGSFGAGSNDMFLAKYDTSGSLSWNKVLGGTGGDYGYDMVQTNDGGYAITGGVSNYGAGSSDMLLVKYDSSGNLSWNKTWGGSGYDIGYSLTQTNDGGYAITGYTDSYGAGSGDTFLAKYDSSGNLSLSKTWGGGANDNGYSLTQISDGGYVISGYTTSFGAGGIDMFLLKYDASGNFIWNKTWGGTGADYGYGLTRTSDGGYAIAGYTASYGSGGNDTFLIKYSASGNINNCSSPMCQTPSATFTAPSATVTAPSATVATPTATITTPTATVTTPTATVTTIVAP